MTRCNDKQKIKEHYDYLSPHYRELWGELHHGYWIRGDETNEQAQAQLVEHLAQVAGITHGSRILDVGCGFGGCSLYLARHFEADVTGITISPVQVDMATQAAARERVPAKFLLMDAEAMEFDQPFDVIWSVESISHYEDKRRFFERAARLLKPGGTMALIDWFKRENLSAQQHAKIIDPIQNTMLVELHTVPDYERVIRDSGLSIEKIETLNSHCAKTWDFCVDLLKNKAVWEIALRRGPELIQFLQAFRTMRAAFRSGDFVYALMIAQKA